MSNLAIYDKAPTKEDMNARFLRDRTPAGWTWRYILVPWRSREGKPLLHREAGVFNGKLLMASYSRDGSGRTKRRDLRCDTGAPIGYSEIVWYETDLQDSKMPEGTSFKTNPKEELIDVNTSFQPGEHPLLKAVNELYGVATKETQDYVMSLLKPFEKGEEFFVPKVWLDRALDILKSEDKKRVKEAKILHAKDFKKVTWLHGYCRDVKLLYHGSRAGEKLRKEGFCVPPAADYVHGSYDWWPNVEDVPPSLKGEVTYPEGPVSTYLADWMNKNGSTEYDWPFLWRRYVWNWFQSLKKRDREIFLSESGIGKLRSERSYHRSIDIIGEHISLIWTTESINTANSYGDRETGGVFQVDPTMFNSWGCFYDDIVSGNGLVFVCPTWCPQAPPEAVKRIK